MSRAKLVLREVALRSSAEIPTTRRPSSGTALPVAHASRVRVLIPGERRRSMSSAGGECPGGRRAQLALGDQIDEGAGADAGERDQGRDAEAALAPRTMALSTPKATAATLHITMLTTTIRRGPPSTIRCSRSFGCRSSFSQSLAVRSRRSPHHEPMNEKARSTIAAATPLTSRTVPSLDLASVRDRQDEDPERDDDQRADDVREDDRERQDDADAARQRLPRLVAPGDQPAQGELAAQAAARVSRRRR